MTWFKTVALYLFTLLYVGAGINHFINAEFYVSIMPPYIPLHLELVYFTGVLEIAFGGLILLKRYRSLTSWATIAMLIAFIPVHIHMLMHSELYVEPGNELGLWLRLPVQGLLILWAWWLSRKE